MEGARQLGFEFRGRTRTHATISFLGQEVRAGPCLNSHIDVNLWSCFQCQSS